MLAVKRSQKKRFRMTNTKTAGSNALRGRRFKQFSLAVLILVIIYVQACQRPTTSNPPHQQRTSSNVFDTYLNTDLPPADGFDFPVGDANASDIQKLYDQIPEGTMVVIL
jgi:hypothetical protein